MKTKIIYEDDTILVINKPAGLATQSAKITQPDVVSELTNYLAAKTGKSQPYLGLVHRLDQPVEGLLVFAKTKQAAAILSKQLTGEDKSCKKCYLAIVCFEENMPKEQTLTDYMIKDNKTSTSKIVAKNTPQAKKAVLTYQVLSTKEAYACVKITLQTGRFHQIRVQMAHAGMPLLGDLKYGTEQSKALSAGLQIKTVALCASELTFTHPKTKKSMKIETLPTFSI